MSIEQLLKKVSIKYRNLDYYQEALIHRSYLNENDSQFNCNERLEFLGDSVLSLVISSHLFSLGYLDEGKMSKFRSAIVCEQTLAEISRNIDLGSYLKLGNGQRQRS